MVAKAPKAVTKPDAWIVVNNQQDESKPSDRGRKSIKNGKVYLDDGQSFELELFNPLQECVLCDIKLNGQSISKSGLVLKPGQRFYLDSFIDDKKKFIFNTYEIVSDLESISAAEKNGSLEVFFYKESVVTINNWKEKFDRVIHHHHYDLYPYVPYYPNWQYYPNRVYCGNNYGTGGLSTGITGLNNNIGTTTTSSFLSGSPNTTKTSVNYGSNTNAVSYTNNVLKSGIETGRVERGTASSQKFDEIDMDFDTNFISSTIIQLLPSSVKPVETKEVVKPQLKDLLKRESDDVIELIKKLSDLHKAGILTDDEFNIKKSELLSKI